MCFGFRLSAFHLVQIKCKFSVLYNRTGKFLDLPAFESLHTPPLHNLKLRFNVNVVRFIEGKSNVSRIRHKKANLS